MIIFGTRARSKVIGEGRFYCPRCEAQRPYVRKRATRYFSLYFVPVIPMGTLGEFVECQTCGTAFEPRVLDMKTPRPAPAGLAQMLNALGERLAAGAPVEYVVRDLTAAGLERDIALDMVQKHLAAGEKTCDDCGLTYAASVATCTECGQPL